MTDNAKGFVTIRLEDSLRAQMQKLADDSERSLSAQIRLAIRQHLALTGGTPR